MNGGKQRRHGTWILGFDDDNIYSFTGSLHSKSEDSFFGYAHKSGYDIDYFIYSTQHDRHVGNVAWSTDSRIYISQN